MSAIDDHLAQVRAGIRRVPPAEAAAIVARGGLLVDTRPVEQRLLHGGFDGAVVVDRNVLEWRLDPTSDHRLPEIDSPDRPVVVACQQGYASSLAVASLAGLGLRQVVDLDGGFEAWAAAGLPVRPAAAEGAPVAPPAGAATPGEPA